MITKKLTILIILKNDSKRFENLLVSIKNNKSLANSKIIVIDDSNNQKSIQKNERIIDRNPEEILYINKEVWDQFKTDLIKRLSQENLKKLLEKIKLGVDSWNVHNVRNIGQIICNTVCDNNQTILSLDGDMLIPTKLKVNKDRVSKPKSLLLMGSPDLSRLEWIRLFISLNSSFDKRDYNSLLFRKMGPKHLKFVMKQYTDLPNRDGSHYHINQIYPKREEMNNGANLNSLQNHSHSMYPPWFDSDWFWFQRLRKKIKKAPCFTKSSIIHNSYKKHILVSRMLEFEEEGKIITTILENKKIGVLLTREEINTEINRRIALLNEDLRKLKIIKLSKNLLHPIEIVLEDLINYLKNINIRKIIKQINSYEKNDSLWNKLLFSIKNFKESKSLLFKCSNRMKMCFLSPHCDDLVFSLGGSLINRYLKDLEVYDIFNKSKYVIHMPNTENISRIRKIEESKALNIFNIRPYFLNYKYATMINYANEILYMAEKNIPKKDKIYSRINKKIKRIMNMKKDRIFIFPLGLGYNIDHRILFEIGKDALYKGYKVLFYEEGGYDTSANEQLITEYLKKNKLPFYERIFYFEDSNKKVDLMKMYQTQISLEIIYLITKMLSQRNGERIWSTAEVLSKINL